MSYVLYLKERSCCDLIKSQIKDSNISCYIKITYLSHSHTHARALGHSHAYMCTLTHTNTQMHAHTNTTYNRFFTIFK